MVRTLTSKEEPDEPDELGEEPDEKDKKKGAADGRRGAPRRLGPAARGSEGGQGRRVDGGDPKSGPLVTPGTYTVRLTVDGKTETTTLEVRPDPRVSVRRPCRRGAGGNRRRSPSVCATISPG